MSEVKGIRLSKAALEFNVSQSRIIEFLKKKGHDIDSSSNPNPKLQPEAYDQLAKEFSSDIKAKQEAQQINLKGFREKKGTIEIDDVAEPSFRETEEEDEPVTLVKDTSSGKLTPLVSIPKESPKVLGKIEDFIKPEKKQKPEKAKPIQIKEPPPQPQSKPEPAFIKEKPQKSEEP